MMRYTSTSFKSLIVIFKFALQWLLSTRIWVKPEAAVTNSERCRIVLFIYFYCVLRIVIQLWKNLLAKSTVSSLCFTIIKLLIAYVET